MRQTRIGLISDTHGLLRAEAVAALRGCARIIHAGDIGKRNGDHAGILYSLARLAPVTVVRGNNDRAGWAATLPETATLEVDGVRILVLHDLAGLARDPVADGIDVVVSGHSHRPDLHTHAGVLYVNPGSAGPCRFSLPVSVGRLWVGGGNARAELLTLAG